MLDLGLPESWPNEVIRDLPRFKQGHVLPVAPLFYSADLSHPIWSLSHRAREAGLGEGVVLLEALPEHQMYRHVIITSNTCDLAEESPNPEIPWLQVAPVYRVDPSDNVIHRGYVKVVTGLSSDTGVYIADLRLELPLEKSRLVGLDPIEGFPSENEYLEFAELLGRRRQRAVLANVVHEVVRSSLRDKKRRSASRWKRAKAQISKVMLHIDEGSREQPRVVQLVIVSPLSLDGAAHEWFEQWWDAARLDAQGRGFTLLANQFLTNVTFDIELYIRLIELDVTF